MTYIQPSERICALQEAVAELSVPELAAFRAWLRNFQLPSATTEPEGELSDTLSVEELVELATTHPNHSDAVEGLYRAWMRDHRTFQTVIARLQDRGMSKSAITNLKHRATSVLPFMREHGLRASVFTVGEVIGAMRDRAGNFRNTPCANALRELLQQPNISQEQAESLRRRYENGVG